ncbi:cob(I)yrinic acid a,c-diamide adenosyltransferase [Natranaerobius trueperi]|uniref:Cob(I)yrinic acid a,c-diamide adenosyltransferase n=1 Tax=Natranaerobius trueperi TaxID=759412 RepID=A0A226BWU1_9FIRM|nr:cob(I)yrinic acid a,c-diamide adenosyltransferase [Natranaerobius trueperi]OWZ83425.1 cob(I)yrinic acid a,c-diamide adenosyltransferase [Natranaerobius trueperi]
MSNHELGTVQVYTGNGKGKTTASLGLALRALGHNFRVCVIQFMKGSSEYGEYKALEKFENATVHLMGRDTFVNKEAPEVEDVELAQEGYEKARESMISGKYDIVILDEVNVALDFHLIEVEQVLELMDIKPKNVELVLTGRNADKEVVKRADLVSEIKEVKHHFQKGIPSRKGVEH